MQRSYNAFAVRVQGEEGVDRRVVPAGETGEGELCIEMRIRLYSDGLMSSLLLQLIKVRRRCGRLAYSEEGLVCIICVDAPTFFAVLSRVFVRLLEMPCRPARVVVFSLCSSGSWCCS